MVYDCIIIGGGASGLFCAAAFSEKINGLILEGSKKAGTKLLMSGSGQCNITHSGSIKDFVSKYGKNGGKIRSCLYQHSNRNLEAFLNQNGVPTMTREDGKVFPKSLNARDVLGMLLRRAEKTDFACPQIPASQQSAGFRLTPPPLPMETFMQTQTTSQTHTTLQAHTTPQAQAAIKILTRTPPLSGRSAYPRKTAV